MFIFYVLCCKPQLTAITMQYYVYKTFKLGVISQLGVVNECSLFQTFLNNLLHLLSRDGCGDVFHKNLQENGHTQKKKNSEEEKWSRQNKLSLRTQKCTGMALVNSELNHGVEIPDSSMQDDFLFKNFNTVWNQPFPLSLCKLLFCKCYKCIPCGGTVPSIWD